MTTLTALQTQDSVLRKQFDEDAEAVKAAQINTLLARVRQAGKTTSGIQEREQLLEILQHWAPVVEEKTGEAPDTNLMAFDPDAEPDDEEIGDEQEPTATYIPGEPQEDQPQTLAQLFMTWPMVVRIGILVVVALILAAIIYWILAPNSDEPVEDVAGTETAVAAAITASAQPTVTHTPTATPRIYIESETSVAESAPVGSPTPIIYVIQRGDTLNSVSRTFGVPVQDIVALNNIYNPDSIPVGQELLIPTPGPGTRLPLELTAEAANDATESQPTSTVPQTETVGETAPDNSASGAVSELVIRSTDIVQMRIAAGPDYQAVADLTPGTFATIIAKTPDGNWYLIQLEDGFTRGWVPAEMTAIIYPADPNTIPTTPMP